MLFAANHNLVCGINDTLIINKINKLLKESRSNLGVNNEKVYKLSGEALALSRQNKLKDLEASSLNIFGYYYLYISEFDEAIKYFERSLLIYQTLKDTSGIANEHFMIGQGHFYKGNYKNAMTHYEFAYNLAKIKSDSSQQVSLLFEIGYVNYSQGNLKVALSFFQEGLTVAEKIPDGESKSNSLYNSIGDIYFEWGDYIKAKEYFNKALLVSRKIKSVQGEAYAINNIGNVYLKLMQFDLALENYNESKKIFQESGYKQGVAITLNNIGMTYEESGDNIKAIRFYEESIRIKKDIGDQVGVSKTYGVIADLLIKEGEYNQAISRIEKSQQIAIAIHLQTQIKDNYRTLSKAFKKLGDNEKALYYYEKFFALNDSLFNEETQKQFAEMQTRFETNQKQKEIELLHKEKTLKNIELSQKNEILTKQKTIILSVVFVLILVIIFSFVIYRQFRQKKIANEILKQQKEEISAQRDEISTQRDQIEIHRDEISVINKDLTASIRYALRIQQALLPDEVTINKMFGEHFLIYLPKDIVSGDFYWTSSRLETDGSTTIIIACADCTGHGVPGAFMSIVAMNLLEKAVHSEKLLHPSEVLNYITNGIHKLLRHSNSNSDLKDGMDIALCSLNRNNGKLEYAGARNPLVYISGGKLFELKGNKHFIGDAIGVNNFKGYTNHHVNLNKDDIIYMFTDGYADQFDGINRKKYMNSRLKELLHKNSHKSMEIQGEIILRTHFEWKQNQPQVDDILVLGIKV
ncbi:MAG: tetratricopeptide repeat protein [Bacteroidia bacterium]|nr:tetratricopeptide repeat protein [Bacteroidia bacterium]